MSDEIYRALKDKHLQAWSELIAAQQNRECVIKQCNKAIKAAHVAVMEAERNNEAAAAACNDYRREYLK